MIGSTNIGSVRMSYRDVRHLLYSIFVGKTACQKILFQILSQKNRPDCESQKSGFGFDPKNPPWVWILWIDNPFLNLPKKTQVSVLGFVEIRICIFPPKNAGLCLSRLSRFTCWANNTPPYSLWNLRNYFEWQNHDKHYIKCDKQQKGNLKNC